MWSGGIDLLISGDFDDTYFITGDFADLFLFVGL